MHTVSHKGNAVVLLDAVTTGTGIVTISPNARNIRIHVRGNGVIGAGTIEIEEAQNADYTGTWSSIVSITPVTDSEIVAHLMGIYGAIQARISLAIAGGGTVTVELISD